MTLQFHSEATGWLDAEPLAAGAPDYPGPPRQGALHLWLRLPDGREATRRNVVPVQHLLVPSLPTGGRCQQCGQHEELHGRVPGRVYRGSVEQLAAPPADAVEPPPPPPPEPTPETLAQQRPRSTRV